MYLHKPESVHENEMYKILWDFDLQMDHSIAARILRRVLETQAPVKNHQLQLVGSEDDLSFKKKKENKTLYTPIKRK